MLKSLLFAAAFLMVTQGQSIAQQLQTPPPPQTIPPQPEPIPPTPNGFPKDQLERAEKCQAACEIKCRADEGPRCQCEWDGQQHHLAIASCRAN